MNALADKLSSYRDAVSLARRIRSLPSDLSPADAFAFNQSERSIAANQKPAEILWLLDLTLRERPQVVLEIGTQYGGTLFLFSRVAAPDALLVSVDISKMVGRLGRLSPHALVRQSFARNGQRLKLVDDVDSHAEETVTVVREALEQRPVDFLFIDGDHAYESVKRDFELYSPLVRPGGLVAFHDVSDHSNDDTEGVRRFWAELRATGRTEECVTKDGTPGYGIGVYRVP